MATEKSLVILAGISRQIPDGDTLNIGAGITSNTGSTLTITAATGNVVVASAALFNSSATVTGLLNADGGIERSTSGALNIATAAGNVTSINIGTGSSVGAITVSRVGQTTTVAGNLQVNGTETVVGATVFNTTVTIGDGVGGPDTLDFNATTGRLSSVTNPNVLWLKEVNHQFFVDASTTVSTVGGTLLIASGAGSAASGPTAGAAGGAYTNTAGAGGAGSTSGNGGAGGAQIISGGTGGVAGSTTGVAGVGGSLTTTGGTGGAAALGTGIAGVGGSHIVAGGAGGAGSTSAAGGAGGATNIAGGAGGANAGAGGGVGGNVTILGGVGSGAANGTVNIGTSNTSAIAVGATGITTSLTGTITVQAASTLNTTGTGNINLPNNASARFQIEGVAVSANVTAANLGTLTAGPASNADALHTHSGVGASTVVYAGTSGEAITVGSLVAIQNASGSPRVFNADSNGAAPLPNVIGVASTAAASAGLAVSVIVSGETATPDAAWDAIPAVTDVGKRAYLSENVGKWTLTAPTTAGSWVLKSGIVSAGGTGAVRVFVQIGEGVLL
jgi:hypothetical protein